MLIDSAEEVQFQPTRPRRARPQAAYYNYLAEFQPTRPRRARPKDNLELYDFCGFNPRAHEGRDVSKVHGYYH